MHVDLQDEFLSRVVSGKKFAEVGGLWGVVNEKVSVAHALGADEVTMIDVTEESDDLWRHFRDRMQTKGITRYRCMIADVSAVSDVSYDVVHCSGVLYHHPHPMLMLTSLRRMTREHLVLTSAVTRHEISNAQGTVRVPPCGVVLVPALSEEEREVLAVYWRAAGAEALGITTPVTFNLTDFGPWWWLPTPEAMAGMCAAAGFEILDRGFIWNNNAHTLLLKSKT